MSFICNILSRLFHRDAVFISLVNCCTSVFAGLAIFCVLGHMAFNLGKDVSEVVTSGMMQYFLFYFTTMIDLYSILQRFTFEDSTKYTKILLG